MTASIRSLTAVASLLSTSSAPKHPTPMPSWSQVQGDVLSAVAAKIGMTHGALTAQLRTGTSLTAVASGAGLSSHDLTATIEASLATAGLPAGVDIGQVATRLAGKVNNAALPEATPTATHSSSAPARGVDTSSVPRVRLGGLTLDSSEVAVLLGSGSRQVDAYL